MLVSVVVPNLNKGCFLEQALESIFQQEYIDVEVIAIDGGSNDCSLEVFEKYRDRFAAFISEPDEGQANAINKGFRLARGDVVAWLNSDDVYYPDAVSLAVAAFEDNPELDLLYGDGIFIDEANRYLRPFTEVEPYSEYRLRNCSDYIMQPTTFFRRKALEEIGYIDEDLHFAFDWDLWCKLARHAGSVKYLPKYMAATRIYPDTKTSSGGWPRLREISQVLRRHRTGWWPPAYWGYLSTELLSMQTNQPVMRRWSLWGVQTACGFLAIENVINHRKLTRGGRAVDEAVPNKETIFNII